MRIQKRKPNPHQICRSLLQKAVRRGDVELATKVARHLVDAGQESWLKGRAYVIAFEECWPIFGSLPPAYGWMELLIQVAKSVKYKDAAGLGSIAYALSQGDNSCPLTEAEEHAARVVACAQVRLADFWAWARRETAGGPAHEVVLAAKSSYHYAGWPWDKTIILAAAFLAATEGVPEVRESTHPPIPCPLWVGIDKHTEAGREALRRTAKRLGIPYKKIALLSFYMEGAVANEAAHAAWWDREVEWRMRSVGLPPKCAKEVWAQCRGAVEDELASSSAVLAEHYAPPSEKQLALF